MPGYANWKDLFAQEYLQLYEEGYAVGDAAEPDFEAAYLPDAVRQATDRSTLTEADWEAAYRALWSPPRAGHSCGLPIRRTGRF